jgi:hypothetical protein
MMFLPPGKSGIEGATNRADTGIKRVGTKILLNAQQAVVLGNPV